MKITDAQDYAIRMPYETQKYNREKSYIIFEGGTEEEYNWHKVFVGSFIVHIYYKGNYRFDCKIETLGNGRSVYSVTPKKIDE